MLVIAANDGSTIQISPATKNEFLTLLSELGRLGESDFPMLMKLRDELYRQTTQIATVTREQAEAVLAAIKKQYEAWVDEGNAPSLIEDFDGRDFTILWEGGPYQWTYQALTEHVDEELYNLALGAGASPNQARKIALLKAPDKVPGVLVEPINHYSIGIYPL